MIIRNNEIRNNAPVSSARCGSNGKGEVIKTCRDPGSNRGPLDLQSNALPTELSRLLLICDQEFVKIFKGCRGEIQDHICLMLAIHLVI